MAETAPTVSVPPLTAVRTASSATGVCPVKPEYIRDRPVKDLIAGATGEAKTRGMNRGSDREFTHTERSGTRPTFEGEKNFLHGAVLNRVKARLKLRNSLQTRTADDTKRPREEDDAVGADTDELPAADVASPTVPAAPASSLDLTEPPNLAAASAAAAESLRAAPSERNAVTFTVQRKDDEPPEAKRQRLFANKLILAPLTTVGNLPYRRICKKFGADVTLSEMAMVFNINHTQKSEWSLMRRHESEDIFGIQVAAKNGYEAAICASILDASEFEYDYIDINCGCPVDLIVQKGCGCGLWERKNKMRGVVEGLVKFQSKPVTIKCRIGPDENDPQLHKVIHEYEGWGASAVTIHGRSRKQRYTKSANWDYVEQCAKLTRLPVIGNGDVLAYEDVIDRRARCPTVSSIMIARGALIKPWVFQEIKEQRSWDISSQERLEMLRDFANNGLAHWGADAKGVNTTRRFMCEWLSFLCRYVPIGLLEQTPQRINDRPPHYVGRDDLETLMASESVVDWIKLTELLLGPAGPDFKFTPKHKSNSYSAAGSTAASAAAPAAAPGGGAAEPDEIEG